MTDAIPHVFRRQGAARTALGSPLYGALCREIAEALDGDDKLQGLLAPWAGKTALELYDDALVLRVLGALHDRVLSGEAPALAAVWPAPGREADAAVTWPVARAEMAAHRSIVAAFLGHEPQTNEVRRSVCLVGGFLTVAAETGLPLRTFEVGASAGLNLNWDRFRYQLGEAAWGDAASPVQLDTDWQGPSPPVDAALRVVSRAACDRRPVELTDPAQRRRLLAYVWPDQFERMARLRAAMDLARELEVKVEAADAPAWTKARAAPASGAATVLYHSVFWQYMPPESQAALGETIAAFGAAATAKAPFAWLRMEPPKDQPATMQVRLTLWPGGEGRLLADVHPHGASVAWRRMRT